jgi:restriction system protein
MVNSFNLLEPLEELPSVFVGREEELLAISKAFFKDEHRVMVIIGTTGVGKTALILTFARLFKDEFPAGIYHLPLIMSREVLDSSLALIPKNSQPCLLILEELGSLPLAIARSYIIKILRERPLSRVLCTSQIPLASPSYNRFIDEYIEIRKLDSYSKKVIKQFDELVNKSTAPFAKASIIGPDGRALTKDSNSFRQIVTEVNEVNTELLHELAEHPNLLYELTPRKFEEIIAELLHRQGYEVEIKPFIKDGGIDICAAKKDSLGTFLYLVQCKKYAPNRPVGVEIVRELYGVVQIHGATSGIIATTSYFTKGAKSLQNQLLYRLNLKDYLDIQKWLKLTLD